MPTYTYKCEDCSEEREIKMSMKETISVFKDVCYTCKGHRYFTKIIKPVPLHFKGEWNDK